MAVYAELFDGTRLEFPDGTDPSVIAATAKRVTQSISSGSATPPIAPVGSARKPEDIGFIERNIGAAKRGVEQLGDITSGLGLAGTALTGTEAETAAKMRDIKREQAIPQETPGYTAADIERIYEKKGLLSAAGAVPSYITEQILQSAPSMAGPLAAGVAAGAVSGPFAPVVGPLVGIGTYGIQQFGNFLTRQAIEKKDAKELDLTKAALTAGATAPLGYFADRFTAGLGGLGTKKAGEQIVKELSARQVAAKVGKRAAVGATAGIIAEAPLEVLEQAAERYQAGLSLTGADAANEYREAFFGAAAAGAGIGGTSRAIQAYQTPGVAPAEAVTPPAVVPPAAVPPEAGPVAPAVSQDTQAMLEEFRNMGMPPAEPVAEAEVAAPVAVAEPDVPQTEEERNRAIEISNGMVATGYVNGILEKAQQGFIRAGQEYEETGSSPSMPRVVDFLRGQLRPLMGSEKADKYIQYLTEEGGLTSIGNAVNSEYFGDAVNGVSKIVKPISIGTRPPAPPAQAPTAPAEPSATVEPMVETPTPDQPKIVEDETGEKLSYPMFVDMADKGYKLYSFENPRTYENKGGVRYRTLEKDGVRLALEPQQVLFTDPKKPNQQPQLGMGNENDVAFHFIGVDPDLRKQGKARQAIQDLIEIADKNNYTLYGEPAQLEKGGMTKDQLLNFYKQFGFKPTNDTNKVIVREPGAKAETAVEGPDIEVIANETTPELKDFDIAKSKETIHDEIKDLDAEQLSQYLIDNAPNSAARHIAEKILTRIKDLAKAGIPVRIEIKDGPIVRKDVSLLKRNEQAATAYGWQQPILNQQTRKLSYYKVSLNGLDQNGKAHRSTGTNYQTIMHEMLHVATSMQLALIKKRNFRGDKQIYNDLMSVRKAIEKRYFEEKAKPAAERSDIFSILRAALDIEGVSDGKFQYGKNSLDELVSHGLTTIEFQEFLSTIKMGNKTALQKLMELFRNLIGVSPEYETALDRLILGSNKLLDQTPEDINKIMKDFGYTAGKLKSAITQSTVAEEDKNKPTAQARNYLGKQIQANWAFPEDNVKHWPGLSDQSINDFLYKIQDKQIDTKNAQKAIEKAAGEIEDNINVYEKEQLYHGRTATGIRKFLLDELMPAIKELGALKLTPQDLKDYLYNRHAPERNDKMNEVNKLDPITGKERKSPWELQDRASGISTKDARAYLANLEPAKKAALEKVAKRFDEMVQGTQQILLKSGAEDQATIDAYNNTYKHYVPLFRIEEDFTKAGGMGATGASKGFGVRGAFSKRAMGSEKEVQDILGNLIAQRERALIRAEKSKVGQALYGLTLTNPNPDLWLPVNPDAIKSRDALVEELQSLGYKDAAQIADNLMEEPKSRYISKEKKQFVDPDTGLPMQVTEESVKLKLDNLKRFGDNVFPVRINGKDRYIFFNKNDPRALRMVHSLMNLDADSLGDIEGTIAKATRWFASVNTQYNPIFGVVNLIRDIGGSTLNLSTTAIAGDQAKVNKNVIPAMRGILNVLRDERKGKTDTKGKWAKAFQDFREQGGQTGYRDSLIRTDEEKQIIEREINKMKSGNTKKAFYAVVGALSDFNDMMENSIRVAAYMAALDRGLSKQKAAILAKNLTVNFDKKGQLSARINAYFAFFNASVQGTARLAKTLKGPKGKAIIGGGIALGAAQAVILAMAGFDEDEPPEFVRERNFVVPLPDGKFLTIPYPLGFNVLPNVGRLTTEFVLSGGKDPGKKVTALLGSVVEAFSPIGGSELSLQTISPTVVDPLVAIATNKDAFGRPIYKKDQATNPTPGYLRSRENASEFSKNIAYFLNLASGGTKYSKGYVSPTGDEIDYLIGQITGGVGRELIKTEQTVKAGITGEELPAYRIPLVGRFYGETQSNAAESQRFYNNIIKMADYENEVKGRIKNKEPVAEYLRENPQARLWQTANNVENQINALNKQKKEFIEKGLPKERIKRIENQKAVIMKRFNDQLAKYEE